MWGATAQPALWRRRLGDPLLLGVPIAAVVCSCGSCPARRAGGGCIEDRAPREVGLPTGWMCPVRQERGICRKACDS